MPGTKYSSNRISHEYFMVLQFNPAGKPATPKDSTPKILMIIFPLIFGRGIYPFGFLLFWKKSSHNFYFPDVSSYSIIFTAFILK
jgi:hypothetical protein